MTFVQFISGLSPLWYVVWAGLAALSIALGVLMRTRWGQSHPLRKCVVLALFAHIFFIYLATAVKVMTDAAGSPHGQTVYVRLEGDDAQLSLPDAPFDPNAPIPDGPLPTNLAEETLETALVEEPAEVKLADQPPPEVAPPSLEAAVAPPERAAAAPPVPNLAELAPALTAAPPPEVSLASLLPPPAIEKPSAVDPPAATPAPLVPIDFQAARTNPSDAPAPADAPLPKATSELPAATHATAGKPAPAGVELHPVPVPYQERFAGDRLELVRRRGGGADTEAAVSLALVWLASSQSTDGRWDARRHGAGHEQLVLGQNRQGAGIDADTGVTGLALLAYLGAGHTHLQGEHAETVARGIDYLMLRQGEDGNLCGRATFFARMYCHGMATLALSEAYAITGDERLAPSVKAAIAYTIAAQSRTSGGWRYQPGDDGDTSQLGWQVMALRSAELAGLTVPVETKQRAAKFLRSVTQGKYDGLASYRPGRPVSRAMTAEALVCRELLGESIPRAAQDEANDYILAEPPGTGEDNYYYWYYGAVAMFQRQGEAWEAWNRRMKPTLLESQRRSGADVGSWDPHDVWGGYGGRVYSTALSSMCLEAYYRYLPMYGAETARQQRTLK